MHVKTVCGCVCACVCLFACACMSKCVSACVLVHMCLCRSLCMLMFECVSGPVCTHASPQPGRLYVLCMSCVVCHVYVCVCVCVCVFVCEVNKGHYKTAALTVTYYSFTCTGMEETPY